MSLPNQPMLSKGIEAILMVSSEPVSSERAAEILSISVSEFESALSELSDFYDSSDRGFYIQRVGGGFRFAARPEMKEILEKYALSQNPPRLSGAVMETLAVIAYRQPISRAQISAIRGVNSDHAVKMLLSRGYVEASSRDTGPRGVRYLHTTQLFLEKLGLFTLSDLPKIEGFLPGPEVAEALEASLFESSH